MRSVEAALARPRNTCVEHRHVADRDGKAASFGVHAPHACPPLHQGTGRTCSSSELGPSLSRRVSACLPYDTFDLERPKRRALSIRTGLLGFLLPS